MNEVSDAVKGQGFKSLAQVAELFSCSTQNLRNWHKSKPQKFQIVLDGCRVLLNSGEDLK
jgi:hypothetical protein